MLISENAFDKTIHPIVKFALDFQNKELLRSKKEYLSISKEDKTLMLFESLLNSKINLTDN